MKSFLGWVGGKSQLAGKIVQEFPEHKTYVEVFGGAGWVLFQKDPAASQVEVYNDINGELVNLMLIVKYRPSALMEAFRSLPFSRELMKRFQGPVADLDEVQRAVRFLYVVKSSFGSKVGAGWAIGKTQPPRSFFNADLVDQISERLQKVYVEHLDFRKLINLWDSPGTLFYLDPPYSGHLGDYYQHQMAKDDHETLRETLGKVKGKWVLSYDNSPMIRKLYKGYRMKTYHLKYSMNCKVKRPMKEELLIFSS